MPNYVTKELQKSQHNTLKRAQYSPHQRMRPNDGATKQIENPLDGSPPIPEEKNHRIQPIVGTLIYYARTMDFTMLPALNTI